MGGRTNFTVDTSGRCFFCLNWINPVCSTVKLESGPPQKLSPSSIYSVQYLSTYLKINMGKVFPETDSLPTDFQTKVHKSKLNVALCTECSTLNDTLSQVLVKLEKAKMEATFWLEQIHSKLGKAGRIDLTHTFHLIREEERMDNGKQKIAEELRNDTLKKCYQELRNSYPRIRVQKIGREEMGSNKSNLIHMSNANPNALKNPTMLLSNTSLSDQRLQDIQQDNIKMEPEPMDQEWLMGEEDASDYSSDTAVNKELKTAPLNNPDIEMSTIINVSASVTPPVVASRETDLSIKLIQGPAGKCKCGYCKKEFSSRSTCIRHQKAIHLEAKFPCHICSKDFNDLCVLRRHLRETTCRTGQPPELKVYKHICHCKLCGTGFVSSHGLQIHLKEAHLRLRNHKCDVCNKKFLRRYHLSNHRRKVHKLKK